MDYMGNREYWDQKFAGSGDKLLEPEKTLADNIGLFKMGSVLDIACGFGEKHRTDSKTRQEDLIWSDDFENMGKYFERVRYIENQDDRGHFVTYIFRRKS